MPSAISATGTAARTNLAMSQTATTTARMIKAFIAPPHHNRRAAYPGRVAATKDFVKVGPW